jgi:hypothetical protein
MAGPSPLIEIGPAFNLTRIDRRLDRFLVERLKRRAILADPGQRFWRKVGKTVILIHWIGIGNLAHSTTLRAAHCLLLEFGLREFVQYGHSPAARALTKSVFRATPESRFDICAREVVKLMLTHGRQVLRIDCGTHFELLGVVLKRSSQKRSASRFVRYASDLECLWNASRHAGQKLHSRAMGFSLPQLSQLMFIFC